MDKKYFTVAVSVIHEDGDKVKKVKEMYLVDAVSVTDAEAKINAEFKGSTLDFDVVSVTATKYLKVIE